MAENLLKVFDCPAKNVVVEIWGGTTQYKRLITKRVSCICVKQNDDEALFSGWMFHRDAAVNNIRKAINKIES